MAETFKNRIDALTGFAVVNGTDSDDAISDWLTDGLKQIINILPPERLTECVVIATLNNSPTTFNLNTATNGKPISVTREDAQGIKQPCREISPLLSTRIKAAQSLLALEEDDDLYVPMITSLKQDYVQAINLLGAKQEAPKEASGSKKQLEALQKLLAQGQ